ncbi:metal-dependent hydrolase [Halomicrobium urmianum]|uniref:metal-dependent hydrolase n=1 Tax=Halomicrobium urmianum TaxID=1586233 RepID=UPI001CD9BE21|nr:metal-dependent hydrolase [Halomicrobium urmianum]
MYRNGHLGAALLLYAPVGFATIVAGHQALALVGGAVVVSLATLPDCDHRLPFVEHRGPTHTLAFAGLIGAGVGAAGHLAAGVVPGYDAAALSGFGFAAGALAVLSHLLADALTPMGITPFWPLSKRWFSASIVRADNWLVNQLLLGLGLAAVGAVIVLAR